MNTEETELARALVALPGWRWALGMVAIDGYGVRRVVYVVKGYPVGVLVDDPRVRPEHRAVTVGSVPDLHHMGTAGALLAMLAATGRLVSVFPPNGADPEWCAAVTVAEGVEVHKGPSLGVAVARALVQIGRCA